MSDFSTRVTPAAAAEATARLLAVRLEDVAGRGVPVASLRGAPVILVYAGRRGADAAVKLGIALQERLAPRVVRPRIVPVACLGEVPAVFRGLARAQLRQAAAGGEILVDFDRGLELAIGMRDDVANVALLDAAGTIMGLVRGAGESCVREVEILIEHLTVA